MVRLTREQPYIYKNYKEMRKKECHAVSYEYVTHLLSQLKEINKGFHIPRTIK